MSNVTFTKKGFEEIVKEHESLLVERVDAIEHLKKSRELGDLKENGYYQASRAKVNAIDRRIREITMLKKQAIIKEPTLDSGIVVGVYVALIDNDKQITYQIVGAYEANPKEGKISDRSPLGIALLGKKAGDKATIQTPSGERVLTIEKVSLTQD